MAVNNRVGDVCTYYKIICQNCKSFIGGKYQPQLHQTELAARNGLSYHPYLLSKELVEFRELLISPLKQRQPPTLQYTQYINALIIGMKDDEVKNMEKHLNASLEAYL